MDSAGTLDFGQAVRCRAWRDERQWIAVVHLNVSSAESGLARHADNVVSRHSSPRLQQPSQAASVARSEWQHDRGSHSVTISRPAFALHGCAM